MTDIEALAVLCDLARRFAVVELTIADCGCYTVTLFVGCKKIIEEDRSLSVAVENVLQRVG